MTEKQVMAAFHRWDINGDGVIDVSELASLLKLLRPEIWSDRTCATLLDAVDTNKNGKIEFREFVAWISEKDDKWDTTRRSIIETTEVERDLGGALEKAGGFLAAAGSIAESVEKLGELSEKIGVGLDIVCPPLAPVFKLVGVVVENAAQAVKNEKCFAHLRDVVENKLRPPLLVISDSKGLMQICGEPMREVRDSLEKAKNLTGQHCSKWWITKWWSAKSFQESYRNTMTSLMENVTMLNFIIIADHEHRLELEAATRSSKDEEHDEEIGTLKMEMKDLQKKLKSLALDAGDTEAERVLKSEEDDVTSGASKRDILAQEQRKRGAPVDASVVAAAKAGNFVEVDRLIQEDPSRVHDSGALYALLHQAVFWESAFGVMMLISHGADINVGTARDDRKLEIPAQSTPLHLAVAICNEQLVRLLLCAGADRKAQNSDGQTPQELVTAPSCKEVFDEDLDDVINNLKKAARKNDWLLVEGILSEHSMPADVWVGRDFNLLHYAAEKNNKEAFLMLVRSGASPLLRTRKDKRLCSELVRRDDMRYQARFQELWASGQRTLQVKLSHPENWTNCEPAVQEAIAKALERHKKFALCELGGKMYEYDLVALKQRNRKSGKTRNIRLASPE